MNWKTLVEMVKVVRTVEVVDTGIVINGELMSIYSSEKVAKEVARKVSYFKGVLNDSFKSHKS